MNTNPQTETSTTDSDGIPLYDRFVLWMFLVAFVLFALILVSDLVLGFFR